VPSPQNSRRLLLIKPAEVLLFYTGADKIALNSSAVSFPAPGISRSITYFGMAPSSTSEQAF